MEHRAFSVYRVTAFACGFLTASVMGIAEPTSSEDAWDGGDYYTQISPSNPSVEEQILNSRKRSVNFMASRIDSGEDRDDTVGFDDSKFYTGLEVFHLDNLDDSTNVQNVTGRFESYLVLDTVKDVNQIGMQVTSVALQDLNFAQLNAQSARSSLCGGSFYVGSRDYTDVSAPFTYGAGLYDTLTGTESFIEMDTKSEGTTQLPTVTGDTRGLVVRLENGVSSEGVEGVFAEDIIGIDVSVSSAAHATTDTTQMNGYRGIRINYPERQVGAGTPAGNLTDFDARSFGILVEGQSQAVANGTKTSMIPGTVKYAGARTEAPLEVADRLVHDPLAVVAVDDCADGTLPIDRPVLVLDPTDDVIINRISACPDSFPDASLPNGTVGQRLTVFVKDSQGFTVTFYDEANLNLAANPRVLGNGDILELIYLESDWHEVSYSNN